MTNKHFHPIRGPALEGRSSTLNCSPEVDHQSATYFGFTDPPDRLVVLTEALPIADPGRPRVSCRILTGKL